MSISDERIMGGLDWLLTHAEPGSVLDHLLVVSAPRAAIGPLGLVDDDKAEGSVYAIGLTRDVDEEQFIAKTIVASGIDLTKRGHVILWAGLSKELVTVQNMDDHARRLLAESRLEEHPRAVEVTVVYAACRDGRRWRGRRWLTGPQAGQSEDAVMLIGPPDLQEQAGQPTLVRRLVGLSR